MAKKKKKKDGEAEVKPASSHWSPRARQQFDEGMQVLRLMGLDEDTLRAMERGMVDLYDPSTGEFRFGDYELFKEIMLPRLLESPLMGETLSSTALLDRPQLRKFWFTAEQMEPCLEECDRWMEETLDGLEEPAVLELLMDDQHAEERVEMGEILYRHYIHLMTDGLGASIYDSLYNLSKTGTEEERKLAKNAMVSFTLFPNGMNAFLQYLFVKSLVLHSDFSKGLPQSFEEDEERRQAVSVVEDTFFAVLCEGEDMSFLEGLEEGDEE
ncbi:MAG: hypothetical protein HYU36_01180 [Planctomycetes bacterium]|nr:hypothetical protein [Planctomycetota bacterium]